MYNKSNIIMHDKIVKKLFTSTHDDIGKRLCARIIAALLDEDELEIYNNIEFIHPNIQANINYPNNEADTVLTSHGTIWNFEYNLNYSDCLHIKNTIYLTQLFLRQLPTMKEIDNIKKVIRVDFDNYDFFLENETNRVVFNEINAIPGHTAISMYPMLMEHAGYSMSSYVDDLIQMAFDRR